MWWENEFVRARKRRLYLGGRPAVQIAGRYGTPLLVYSRPQILANCETLRRAFSQASGLPLRVCYAMKANPHREILRLLRRQDAWIDAVSPREVEEALRAGRLAVEREVRSALIDLQNAHRALEVARQAADLSGQRLELARQRYQVGQLDFALLQQIMSLAAQSERQVVEAEVNLAVALVSLEEAVGAEVRP